MKTVERGLPVSLLLAPLLLVASAGLADGARADSHWYGSVGFGHVRSPSLDAQTSPPVEQRLDPGLLLRAAVGRRFDRYRVEVEGVRFQQDVDRLSSAGTTALSAGEYHVHGVMANGLVDFKTGTKVTPYLGAGAGVVNIYMSDVRSATIRLADDDEWEVGFQAMAGAAYEVTRKTSIGLGYRFLWSTTPDFRGRGGATFENDGLTAHAVEATVGMRF